jgi:hypothetical protein
MAPLGRAAPVPRDIMLLVAEVAAEDIMVVAVAHRPRIMVPGGLVEVEEDPPLLEESLVEQQVRAFKTVMDK